jgi:hypothetical protein
VFDMIRSVKKSILIAQDAFNKGFRFTYFLMF